MFDKNILEKKVGFDANQHIDFLRKYEKSIDDKIEGRFLVL